MLKRILICAIACSVGCEEAGSTTSPPPLDIAAHRDGELDPTRFVGLDVNQLSDHDRAILVMASTDFSRVVSGDQPVHAIAEPGGMLDGGTSFYVGNSYRLTVVRSISRFGTFDGVVYGPVLTFDESFAPGNWEQISDLRIYSGEELTKLLTE